MSVSNFSPAKNKNAIVIGASIAGLLAARVLSSYFENVLVIERDVYVDEVKPRKGAAQGHHAHALLKSGELALEQLFPGLTTELEQKGAHRFDFSADVKWFHFGHWKLQYQSDFPILIQSRPLIEQTIRRRVACLKNVTFYNGYSAENLIISENHRDAIGLHIQKAEEPSVTEDLLADMIVDASGRGSKVPQWLENLNYGRPEETAVKIDLMYSSRLFAAPSISPDNWKMLVLNPQVGRTMRAGYIFPIENDRWLVTLAGYSGDHTPQTNESFADYAQGLATPHLYNAIRALEPVSDVKAYRVPVAIRHHYEKMSRMPTGLIVMGDAFCAFDPVFGQGMSIAANEAILLNEMLSSRKDASSTLFQRRFHQRLANVIRDAWLLTTSEDFRYPKTEGKKAFFIPMLHWYAGHIFELSATDKGVYTAFRDVMHLQQSAFALFKPGLIAKVMTHAITSKKLGDTQRDIQNERV